MRENHELITLIYFDPKIKLTLDQTRWAHDGTILSEHQT